MSIRSLSILVVTQLAACSGCGSTSEHAASPREPSAPVQPVRARIAADGHCTCAIDEDGGAVCWGDCLGSRADSPDVRTARPEPHAVAGVSSAVHIAIADDAGCVLDDRGAVICWGVVSSGDEARRVEPLARAIDVAVGDGRACAVLETGGVSCWPRPGFGVELEPLAVEGVNDARSIAMRDEHACVVTSAGEVWCWQTATDEEDDHGFTLPERVGGLEGAVRTGVIGGELAHPQMQDRACALMRDGHVRCWGAMTVDEDGVESLEPPRELEGLGEVTALAMGAGGACARHRDGSWACWGVNTHGELGTGDTRATTRAVAAPAFAGATEVALGWWHGCGLVAPGRAACVGDGSRGALGTNPPPMRVVPLAELTGVRWISIDARGAHAGTQDAVYTWAAPDEQRTGALERSVPRREALREAGEVVDVDAPCVLYADGRLRCSDELGGGEQLSIDGVAEMDVSFPQIGLRMRDGTVRYCGAFECWSPDALATVRSIAGARSIAIGDPGTGCAIVDGGGLRCWDGAAAREVPLPAAAREVAFDGRVCVLLETGAVQCARDVTRFEPVLDRARHLAVTQREVCAIRDGGGIACRDVVLGNIEGEVVPVDGIDDAQAFALDGGSGCALRAGGRVSCWDRAGSLGELAVAATLALSPVEVRWSSSDE